MPSKVRLTPRVIGARQTGVTVAITPRTAGWKFVRFAVHQLAPDAIWRSMAKRDETCLVLLEGRCEVECDGVRFTLSGSGSTMVALTRGKEEAVGEAMVAAVRSAGANARWLALEIDQEGAVIEQPS